MLLTQSLLSSIMKFNHQLVTIFWYTFANLGPLFVSSFFSKANTNKVKNFNLTILKSIDFVLGIRTHGRRMVGTDGYTELWQLPIIHHYLGWMINRTVYKVHLYRQLPLESPSYNPHNKNIRKGIEHGKIKDDKTIIKWPLAFGSLLVEWLLLKKLIPDSCRIRLGIFDSKSFKNGHSRPLFLYFRLFNTVESKY